MLAAFIQVQEIGAAVYFGTIDSESVPILVSKQEQFYHY